MTYEEAIEEMENIYQNGFDNDFDNDEIEKPLDAIRIAIEALEMQSEIIHCKDCENWIIIPNSHNIGCCKFAMWLIGENGFCLYGKVEE